MRIEPGTRALVTGAGRGIGRALAQALAARGARVGLLARSEPELVALAAALPGEGHVPLPCDVGERPAVEAAVGRFAEATGGLDLVVANAGIAHYGPFRSQPIEHAEAMVRVNVLGTLYTVSATLPRLLDRAEGHIVVLSSGAGIRAFPWGAVYGGTKAFDRGFGEALRHELSGTGVELTVVYPGRIDTALHDHEKATLPDWYHRTTGQSASVMATAILAGVEAGDREVLHPANLRLLRAVQGISPRLADRMLRRMLGGGAAPRVD